MSEPEYDDDYVVNNSSDDEDELEVEYKSDEEFGGDDEEEQLVVGILPLKKLKKAVMAVEEKKINRTMLTSEKSLLVLNEKSIQISIDMLLGYLQRINSSIQPSVAQEIESRIVERSETGGINYFVNELAKYLTVFGYAREVHFDKLIGELSQPEVNITNVIQSVTDNASQFSENLLGQKRVEILNAINSVANPTARKQTTPSNILRLQPLKEIVLYVPTITQVDEQVVMQAQEMAIQEEEETSSSDFVFFMNILDTYQRQATQQQLTKMTPMKAVKSKLKSKTKFETMQEDVNRIYRIRRESEKAFLAEQRKAEEQEQKRLFELAEKAKAKTVVEPKKKPGRPAGGSSKKHAGGKMLSPEIITCTYCKVEIGSLQLRSMQQHSNNQFDKVQFCSFTCLNNHNFRSKKI
jgi:hypothetical protein